MLPALGLMWEAWFSTSNRSILPQNVHVLDPQTEWETHVLGTLVVRIAPLLARLVLYALQSPNTNLLAVRDLCVFSLWSPIRYIKQAIDTLNRCTKEVSHTLDKQ